MGWSWSCGDYQPSLNGTIGARSTQASHDFSTATTSVATVTTYFSIATNATPTVAPKPLPPSPPLYLRQVCQRLCQQDRPWKPLSPFKWQRSSLSLSAIFPEVCLVLMECSLSLLWLHCRNLSWNVTLSAATVLRSYDGGCHRVSECSLVG